MPLEQPSKASQKEGNQALNLPLLCNICVRLSYFTTPVGKMKGKNTVFSTSKTQIKVYGLNEIEREFSLFFREIYKYANKPVCAKYKKELFKHLEFYPTYENTIS